MESSFEIGDEYDGDDRSSVDCSDDFEQGLTPLPGYALSEDLMQIALARLNAFFIDKVMEGA